MDNAIKLLKILKGTQKVEFSDLKNILSRNNIEGKKNIYFCCGVGESLSRRCHDDDIKMKKYFVVDIDVRMDHYSKYGKVLDDDEMMCDMAKIVQLLQDTDYNDYSAVVNSGNGLHLYYVGTERSFDKNIYSQGVQMIYEEINDIIKETGYICDHACHNLARVTRLPGTINPRKKEKKGEVLWDLGDYVCDVLICDEKQSKAFESIEEYAKKYEEEKKQEKIDAPKIHKITKEYTKADDIWADINAIPAYEIACDIWGVSVSDKGLDNVALKESKKNMGAYWYRPKNIIVNTGSSLITTNKSYFTSYELVYYEYANQGKSKTLDYFKNKRGIETKKEIQIEQQNYEKQGYIYGNSTFDALDCVMSGELVIVVALSNTGKTTFAMDMIQGNVKLGKKCFYINLEFAIETVRQSRRLYANGYKKRNLTDLSPLSSEQKDRMDQYVKKQLNAFDSFSDPKGIDLEVLVEIIKQKQTEGYGFFVVDTLSRINGNMDSKISHTSQNKCMQVLQELCQKIGVVVVLLHHTNKQGNFEGSQKIMDLSNVFLTMEREEDSRGGPCTKFTLSKDKFVSRKEIIAYYNNGEYSLSDNKNL